MEKIMSVEDKIRRAEEIYQRRRIKKDINEKKITYESQKKELKLFKKTVYQICICLFIYLLVSFINSNNSRFSYDFTNKARDILASDFNFKDLYLNIKDKIDEMFYNGGDKNNDEEINEKNNEEKSEENIQLNQQDSNEDDVNEHDTNNAIGGAVENVDENVVQISQTDQDIERIKNTTTFIKPIEGIISSKYGFRESATGKVPKNHTGIDIASSIGNIIKSSTDGEVVIASDEGDYGVHLKIQIGDVSIIYAHCNKLLVKQGDKVKQGQEIAEVGSTGNSTGPHLHFEIRINERTVDPQKILEI